MGIEMEMEREVEMELDLKLELEWNSRRQNAARKSFYDNFSRVSSFDQASAWRTEKTHSSMNVNMIFNHTHAHTPAAHPRLIRI